MLSTIIFLPLVGAILIALSPKDRQPIYRGLAAAITGLSLALSLVLYFSFQSGTPGVQFQERFSWVPSLGISYFVGVDGLNLPMVLLTSLLTFLAVLASWRVQIRSKEYFALLLILETGVLGVFSSLDFLVFFLFWEVELIPMYLLIGIWGGPKREYAAIKFVIYTLVGSSLMLLGILALYFQSSPRTFDMLALSKMEWAPQFASVVFVLLFIGFAVKLPVFPFHTWLPDAHVEAPTAVSVLLAGVLLKMGGYGILRANVGILPGAAAQFAGIIAVLAVVNILYGAVASMVQRDLKSLVAYSSVSHMGYVLLGVAALTPIGLSGAALQMFTHGTITGLLFLLVGSVYERTHTRQIADMSGLAPRMPIVATLFVMAGLASLGLPGMSGFIAEFTVFIGSYGAIPLATILGAFGIVITAGYTLWMLQRVFFGPPTERWASLRDIRGIEIVPLVSLIAVIIVVGVYPAILTNVVNNGIATLVSRLGL